MRSMALASVCDVEVMIPGRIIEAKRDGIEIDPSELRSFFERYLEGQVEDYQMSAFLMAVVFRGFSAAELDAFVDVMVGSGATLSWPGAGGPVVDKHSTGGIGDKVSLVLAPLAAALGLRVPMMSGRGLGHTTGTLDKLEAISGFDTRLSLDRFTQVLEQVGCAMIGQTAEIAPLDRRLYDLRSVTGTVPCIPLIAASIMSKKLAEGLDGLVLDVKAGAGAFLADEAQALELARTMVHIGEARGVATVALITAMDRPLGHAIGNALETREAIDCLHGRGPADLRELVLAEAVEMLRCARTVGGEAEADEPPGAHTRAEGHTYRDAYKRAEAALASGAALERFRQMVAAQQGDVALVDDPTRIPQASHVVEVAAECEGIVSEVHPRQLGEAVVALGGGRTKLGDGIDLSVGFEVFVRPGDAVQSGSLLGRVHARDPDGVALATAALSHAVSIGYDREAPLRPLISHRVTTSGVQVLTAAT